MGGISHITSHYSTVQFSYNLAGCAEKSFHQTNGIALRRFPLAFRYYWPSLSTSNLVRLSAYRLSSRYDMVFAKKGFGLGTFRTTLDRILHSLLRSYPPWLLVAEAINLLQKRPQTYDDVSILCSIILSVDRMHCAVCSAFASPCYLRSFRLSILA